MTVLTEHSVIGMAADLIDQRGYAVGQYVDDNGCLCVLGAISEVVFGDPLSGSMHQPCHGPAWHLYLDVCFLLTGHLRDSGDPVYKDKPSLSDWSDAAGRDRVIAAMRACAAGGES